MFNYTHENGNVYFKEHTDIWAMPCFIHYLLSDGKMFPFYLALSVLQRTSDEKVYHIPALFFVGII